MDSEVVTTALGHDVHAIDTLMSGYQGITAGYLIAGERPCLVETGTARSAPQVQRALDSLGIGANDLATIAVTHIHLDHAGGVGDLAAAYPSAQIVVHQRGARHLADPSTLMASARRVFGDLMDTVFGALAATEADRIRAVDEVGEIDLGGGERRRSGDRAAEPRPARQAERRRARSRATALLAAQDRGKIGRAHV